jgi:hypothetical protein
MYELATKKIKNPIELTTKADILLLLLRRLNIRHKAVISFVSCAKQNAVILVV